MLKRIAAWLEKVSVAALAIGVFQGKIWGIVLTTLSLVLCLMIDDDIWRLVTGRYITWTLATILGAVVGAFGIYFSYKGKRHTEGK